MKRSGVWLLVFALLAACRPQAPHLTNGTQAPPYVFVSPESATATATPFAPATFTPLPPTPTAPPSPTATATFTPTPEPVAQRPQYNIAAQLDWETRQMDVVLQVRWQNRSQALLDALVLDIQARRWDGAFAVQELHLNGTPIELPPFDGTYWKIPLPETLRPGESILLEVAYRLNVPYKTQDAEFGYSGYQLNLVDWYPRVVPYDDRQGWLWHKEWPFGETQAYELADFDVTLTVQNAPEGLVVAAPVAPVDAEGTRYLLPTARTLAFSLSPEFLTETRQVGDVTVTSYFLPDLRFGGRAAADVAAQALAYFQDWLGPYPRQHLAVVATTSSDGMEYSGLVFVPRFAYEEYDGTWHGNLAMLTAHEVAHQWWYDQVGNDQALYPWLDEALCTYGERMFYQSIGQEDAYWWWNFRIFWFDPQGPMDGSVYQYSLFRNYVNGVYLRGALFMDGLRKRMGDEAFTAFLRDYLQQMQGALATPDDFFRVLDAHIQDDYSDLLQTYFSYR